MLALETASVRTEMGHADVAGREYHEAWSGVVDSIIFLESTGGYGRAAAGSEDALADLRAQHDAVRSLRWLCGHDVRNGFGDVRNGSRGIALSSALATPLH